MTLFESALDSLHSWVAFTEEQERLRRTFVQQLELYPHGLTRSCRSGHLTGSAIVVNAERSAVALVFHPRVGRWIQPGGHVEPSDRSLAEAAWREATEETGIEGLRVSAEPVDLDIHQYSCPKGTPNRHLDVRYVCIAPPGADPVCSAESVDVRWFDYDGLPADLDTATRRLIEASRQAQLY